MVFRIEGILANISTKVEDHFVDQAIFIEDEHFMQHLSQRLRKAAERQNMTHLFPFIEFIKEQKASEYADQIIINLKDDRTLAYMQPNYDDSVSILTNIASKISDALGLFPFEMDLPVLKTLEFTKYSSMVLGMMMDIIIIVLFAMSVLLIYSMKLLNIEQKTFEFGILRMLGSSKRGIIYLILTESLFFIVPAIVIGFLLTLLALI